MSVTKSKWPHDNMFLFCIHISYNFFIFFGKNKLFTWEYPVMITKLLPCCFDSSLRITITKELLKCHHIHCHHCRPWICPRTCRPCSLPWSSSRRRNWWTCAGCCSREICRIHSCAPTGMNLYWILSLFSGIDCLHILPVEFTSPVKTTLCSMLYRMPSTR